MAHKKKLKKMYIHVAGQTIQSHKKFIKKLKQKGAKNVKETEASDVTIVFCPIVSRFETDVQSALAGLPELQREKVIIVAMHHTHNPAITLPICRNIDDQAVILLVDCLFHEAKGLLKCQQNQTAFKQVRKEMGFKKYINWK